MDDEPRESAPAGDDSHPPHWADWLLLPVEGSARPLPPVARWLNAALAVALGGLAICAPFLLIDAQWHWSKVWEYRQKFIDGYKMTVMISVCSLVLSVLLGVLSSLAGRSRVVMLRFLNRGYIDLVRGTPLLVQILVLYYVTADALRIDDRNVCGVLILSFSYGAYISEICRAGVESVGKSQLESAKAIGLTTFQTYRYVILPQAARQVLPSLAGQLVSLIKDSALLSTISVAEFTLKARETSNITATGLECYLVLAAGYLVLTLPVSWLTRLLEARSRFET